MDWALLDIATHAERDAVCMALLYSGYTVRLRARGDGDETAVYIEYGRDGSA